MKKALISRNGAILLGAALAVTLAVAGCRRPPPPACVPCVSVPRAPAPTEPFTVWLPVAGRTVILDPGHGGKDGGASHFDVVEKDVNLDLARRAAQLLRGRGVIVHLTRDGDDFVALADRSALANARPNAVFVSVHVNASDKNPEAAGVETFILAQKFTNEERGRFAADNFRMDGYYGEAGRDALSGLATHSRGRGPDLARCLQLSLTSRLAERDRGVKTGNLAVLRETYFCPAVLVEVGFVSNPRTAERMKTEAWRQTTAAALADGIIDFLRLPEKR